MNRDQYHLDGCQTGRQSQALIIAMSHDDGAHHACAHAPGSCPAKFLSVFRRQVLHIKSASKILPEVMAGAGLQSAPIPHHRFDRIGMDGTSKPFFFALQATEHRDGGIFLSQIFVDLQHLPGFRFRFLACSVRGMAFLPQEFTGPQESPWPQFPAHHIGPLIDQQRQVAIRLNPIGKGLADDRFRSWSNHIGFFQFLTSSMGDDCKFRTETFNVFRFALNVTLRDEEWEVCILMASRFELLIQ